MSTTSTNLSLTLAEGADVVNVDTHIAANFATLDSKWSSGGTPANVLVGTVGTPGSSTVVSRSDHVHQVTTGTPSSVGTANSAGSNTTVSASDHIHKLGDDSVTTASIQASAVTTVKINDLAVTTGKLNDLAVTTGKITNQAVTGIKLALDAVTTPAITDLAVTAAKLASDSVTEAKLDVLDSPANDEVLTYDSATGRLEWQAVSALITVGAVVPSGLIAAFATAAAIASGWARYSTADGRMLVGAGTTFGVAYVENTSYGSAWSHDHYMQDHGHTMSSHTHTGDDHNHSFSATSGSSGSSDGLGNNGGVSVNTTSHTHGVSGTTGTAGGGFATGGPSTNSTSGPTTANTQVTSWVIPSHAVVWAQKA